MTKHDQTPYAADAVREVRQIREFALNYVRSPTRNEESWAREVQLMWVSKLNDLLHAHPSGLIE